MELRPLKSVSHRTRKTSPSVAVRVVPLRAGQPSGTNGAGVAEGVVVSSEDELVDVTLTG